MKKLLAVFVFIMIISVIPQSFSQLGIGEKAYQKSLDITIGADGKVHVVHELYPNSRPTSLTTIDGEITNLKVTDLEGEKKEHGISEGEQNIVLSIFPSKTGILIEYDLSEVLKEKNGLWSWQYIYADTERSVFHFPDEVDLVFVNANPVLLQDIHKIGCHGCEVLIEYVPNEETKMQKIVWEGKEFDVGIRSVEDVKLVFDQPSKSISFDLKKENQLVTLIIPLELLWNPYTVFLDDQKILKHEFLKTESHVWISVKPKATGTVQIIGTSVVPEFSLLIPLVLGIVMVVGLQYRAKIIHR
ncbi:MAG: hypothetical protein DWQ18_00635 [Crenarchaeota archaeon]|nr:MAG: hypothetical protein DWQ17_04580 [Thermoproteota archaeon]RDJ34483.1 MAG: hypothetical protein DWQ18_00635 [Thermoproteota archaeon]RDJ34822.1 MAG: hypothetical protein DWQ19_13750 [Thermoproteota archaeon]RDJ38575.1 MAG: hypothetical protein DWQ13_04185 [Thermoproteota archaeon]